LKNTSTKRRVNQMKKISLLIIAGLLSASAVLTANPAQADLLARGPVTQANGYPAWYQDFGGLALGLCLDQTPFVAGVPGPTACVLTPDFDPDPAVAGLRTIPGGPFLPIATDRTQIADNTFPDESFYYMASTSGVSPGGGISVILYEAAVEAGFASAVVDNGQAVFTRIRVRANVTQPGTYTMTHPYGEQQFNITSIDPGAPEINFSNDVPGLIPGLFDIAVTPTVGFLPPFVGPRFLSNANGAYFVHPVTGIRYLSDNGAPVTVTGGLNGINSVTITGPAGTFFSDTFTLMGKVIGTEITPPAEGNGFGAFIPNITSADRTYTVTNFTGLPATIAPLVNSNTTDFTVDPGNDDCSNAVLNPVAPGNTCTFGVRFRPTAEGAKTATITISTPNAPNASITVTGSGDATAPAVVFGTGQAAQFSKTANSTISGTVTDASGVSAVQVSVNGGAAQPATLSGNAWSFNVTGLNPNSANTIAVTATDTAQAAGNTSTAVNATITHDDVPPVVSPTGLTNDQLINKPALQALTVAANDLNLAATVVKVDGAIVTPPPATLEALSDGAHTIAVEATDSAGNLSVALNNIVIALSNGDLSGNGSIGIEDALQALRIAVDLSPQPAPNTVPFFHGDVAPLGSPNGTVDIADALLILRKVVGLVNF
jgi:hypothetical protein